ncbi:MAG TPA: putative porin, partial [Bacteroidia bacterium]|nr:putative porin [Bacteroidia bacterium]
VQIIHAHPFGKNCNIAFGFDRVRSEGFYRRQNTNNSNLDLNGWYRSPGRKYSVLGNVFWNGSNIAQNGGIKDDALFESATQFDRQLVAINLSSASTRQRMRGISIKQYRSFGPVTDTLSEKSDSTAFRSQIRPHWAIAHSVEFLDESYVFEDNLPSSGFYENIFLDSNQTLDSTYLWRIENGLWLEKFRAGRKGFSGRIGGRYEAGEIINDTIYRHFTNIYIDGRVSYITRNVGDAFINAWYAIEGFNKGDYKIQAEIRTIKSGLIFEQSTLSPEFVFTNYSGNHFRWQNDFGKSDITAAKIYFVPFTSKFNLLIASFQWNSYYRPVYFNEFLMPEQYYATVNAFAVRIRLDLGKEHFRTKSFLTWNRLPEGSPIRLPEFIIRESFYLNYKLFKSALLLQAGIDLTWFSSYFADAYNPNVAQFYVQDSKAIGSYVYLDAWVSMKIKSVRVFIKADHLNAGWFGRTYYLTPHYPYPDFALKFGIAWVFND